MPTCQDLPDFKSQSWRKSSYSVCHGPGPDQNPLFLSHSLSYYVRLRGLLAWFNPTVYIQTPHKSASYTAGMFPVAIFSRRKWRRYTISQLPGPFDGRILSPTHVAVGNNMGLLAKLVRAKMCTELRVISLFCRGTKTNRFECIQSIDHWREKSEWQGKTPVTYIYSIG